MVSAVRDYIHNYNLFGEMKYKLPHIDDVIIVCYVVIVVAMLIALIT